MSCSTPIAWYDNIPLVSYLVLRGRCRHCQTRIGLIYPAVELVAALLVSACVLVYGLTLEAAIAAFFCCVLVAISAVDIEHRIVPDRIVLPATVVVLVAQTVREPSSSGFSARSAPRSSSSSQCSPIRREWGWATSSSRF